MKHHDEPFYRRIISDAWHIAWHHKHLWVFGFFATLIGFGAVTNPLFNASDRVFEKLPMLMGGQGAYAFPGLATFRAVMLASPFPLLAFVVALLVLSLFCGVFAWMTYVSVGAIISSVRKIERGGDPHFADEVKAGTQTFWPVLGVNLFTQLFLYAMFMLVASSLRMFMTDGSVWRGLFYVGTFMAFTLLAVGASIAAVYASCEVVAKGRSMRAALETGASLAWRHWLLSFELAVTLMVSVIAVGIATIIVALIGSVPFIFMIFVAAALKIPAVSAMVVVTALVVMVGLIVVAGSFLTAFQAAAWTLMWSSIESKKHAPPKLVRLARKHLPFLA